MSDAVLVAIVGGIALILVPLLTAVMTGAINSRMRKQEWARQDAVAAEAKRVSDQALESARTNAALLGAVKNTTEATHAIANSQMTEARKMELYSTRRELILLREARQSAAVMDEIKRAEIRIEELTIEIAAREKQQADAKVE